MDAEKITDLSLQDLEKLIETIADERIRLQSERVLYPRPKDERSLGEVLADIARNRWTPPPDAKSSLELLREDRDA